MFFLLIFRMDSYCFFLVIPIELSWTRSYWKKNESIDIDTKINSDWKMTFRLKKIEWRELGLLGTSWNRNFYLSFWRSNIISCERVRGTSEIAILPQFLAIEPRFVRKGYAGHLQIAILPQFLAIEPHFVRKGCAGQVEIAILPQFLTIEPHFVRKGCVGHLQIAILPQFLAIEPRFVRKGCAGQVEIAILPHPKALVRLNSIY